MPSNRATCRRCDKEFLWAHTGRKSIPIDPQPVDDGNILLWAINGNDLRPVSAPRAGDRLQANILTHAEIAVAKETGLPLWVSHFTTCPYGDELRRQ